MDRSEKFGETFEKSYWKSREKREEKKVIYGLQLNARSRKRVV